MAFSRLTTTSLLLLGFSGCLFAQSSGPVTDSSETIARPRKKDAPAEAEQPKIPSKLNKKNDDIVQGPSFHSEATTIDVDVSVLTSKGQFIPSIPKDKFRILEDDVPQQIKTFSVGEAPMTICMVIEFSNKFQSFYSSAWFQTLQASYGFLETLKPEDYVAVVAYDMKPEMLSDFSTDKSKAQQAMSRLRIAGFSEANMYDALVDTADRMSSIEGRKAILLISSGIDTFSKLTFDKARKAIQSAGVPVYCIGLMQALRMMADSQMGPIQRMDFLQADNTLKTFSKETGGQAFFPRFSGEFPSIFKDISDSLRNQYQITYTPTNLARDGKFRKIRVELVNPATGEALRITDEKGKPIKYTLMAKPGYTAPREVE